MQQSPAVEGDLAHRSKQLRAMGSDPADNAQAVAAALVTQHQQQAQPQGSFMADVQVENNVRWGVIVLLLPALCSASVTMHSACKDAQNV